MADEVPDWSAFYTALGELAPAYLTGVHREFTGFIEIEARDTDAFWSWSLEPSLRRQWESSPELAVGEALDQWLENVREHLDEIMGPWSLMPFEKIGFDEDKQREVRQSVSSIQLRKEQTLIEALVKAASGQGLSSYRPSADFSLSAVVEPLVPTSEGKLIRTLELPWRLIISKLRENWGTAYALDPRIWEEIIAAAFDNAGYDEVTLTPRSGDHGRDVIAIKGGVGTVRVLGSVKAYKRGHLVKHDDVRALAGVLLGDQAASKGIVMTTSDFAPTIGEDPFIKPLIPFRLELMNGQQLREWLDKVSGYSATDASAQL